MAQYGEEIAAVQAKADANESALLLKADAILLEGLVTAEQLKTELEEFGLSLGDSIVVRTLNVSGATSTDSLNVTDRATVGAITVNGTKLTLKKVSIEDTQKSNFLVMIKE